MTIAQLSPEDAQALLERDPSIVYVDVRTPAEFESGHPEGAINIPFFLAGPGGMQPNTTAFTTIAEVLLPKDRPFVIGCQAGGRSQRACEYMTSIGYNQVYNVAGGFGAWLQCGLPTEVGSTEDSAYSALAKKAEGLK